MPRLCNHSAVCAYCGEGADGFSVPDGEPPTPKDGDFAICVYCSEINQYTVNLSLKKLNPDDLKYLDLVELQQCQAISKMFNAIPKG